MSSVDSLTHLFDLQCCPHPVCTFRSLCGCSSGGAAAFGAAWFGNQWFQRSISFSPAFVSLIWQDVNHPLGMWEMHANQSLISQTPRKDHKSFLQVGDQDIYSMMWYSSLGMANPIKTLSNSFYQANGYFNIVLGTNRTATLLSNHGYDTLWEYTYSENHDVEHCDPRATAGTSFRNGMRFLWKDAVTS